ncbi:MAG: hypothetical protein HUU10_11655 [Bacteroidetes bacterium]|nr:hypothetical protein [Bacteroidota bacterium]
MNKLILLGAGFAAEAIRDRFLETPVEIHGTSRHPKSDSWINLRFDLSDKGTWSSIPEGSDLIWTFPAVPEEQVREFHAFLKSRDSVIRVVLGTTSCYLPETGEITELSPVNHSTERVRSELFLKEQGANWLVCSGLWGYGKHPYEWLAKGLIRNRNKTVNLIHVSDLAEYIQRLLVTGDQGLQLNVSDGKAWWWRDLVANARRSYLFFGENPDDGPEQYRLIRNDRLVALLGQHHFHTPFLVEDEGLTPDLPK